MDFETDASKTCKAYTAGQLTRQGLSLVLSGLMILVPAAQNNAFAQEPAPFSEQAAAPQPLAPAQLDQLVAPIALYPDSLVAQILAASTYPAQVQEADRWRQAQGNAPAEVIAADAESQNWDPSVKALTAFPTVLVQMDRNIQWTTSLGDAYYNQPQDVMDAVQAMRQKAYAAGHLRNSPQQVVTRSGAVIMIAPARPEYVYVPVYDPWVVYGPPVVAYPGYFYATPPGVVWGTFAIGFGVGIGITLWAHHGWGWGHWGMGWHDRCVMYNRTTYITRSTTVINHGWGRPGGPRFYDRHPGFAHGGFDRRGPAFGGPHGGAYHVAGSPHVGGPRAGFHGGASRPANFAHGPQNHGGPHTEMNHMAPARMNGPAEHGYGRGGHENFNHGGGHFASPQRASMNMGHGGGFQHADAANHGGGHEGGQHGGGGGHAGGGHGDHGHK